MVNHKLVILGIASFTMAEIIDTATGLFLITNSCPMNGFCELLITFLWNGKECMDDFSPNRDSYMSFYART